MNIVTMRTGDFVVSLPAAAIRKVVPARGLTSIPLSRKGVLGVIVHDHRAVPVFRLDMLSLDDTPAVSRNRVTSTTSPGQIVILEEEGALAGLLVETTATGRTDNEDTLLDHRTILAATGMLPGEAWGGTSTDSVRGDK